MAAMLLPILVGASLPSPMVLRVSGPEIAHLSERLKAIKTRPLRVELRGEVNLEQPLRLGSEASGVEFVGSATIRGGVRLPAGRVEQIEGREYTVIPVPGQPIRMRNVVADGRRLRPSGSGPGDWVQFAGFASESDRAAPWNQGQSRMRIDPAGPDARRVRVPGAEVVTTAYWVQNRLAVTGFEATTGTVTFDRTSTFKLSDDGWSATDPPGFYRVENADLPAQPDEFRYDPERGVLILRRPARTVRLGGPETLLRIEGASDFSIRGLTFTETEPQLTSAGDWQGGHSYSAAVQLVNTRQARIEACTFVRVGNWGLEISGAQARQNVVERNKFLDLGGGGIKLANDTQASTIAHNLIDGGGKILMNCCGIWAGLTGKNRIVRNRIRDLYYTGISVGWDWGFQDTPARENRIEGNDIERIGQGQLSDMGGIYTLGKQPGTVLRNNRIRDVKSRKYGGWGIYLDEGSSEILVENNLVIGTRSGGFHIHYGRDNRILRNVFMDAEMEGVLIRTRDDKQGPIVFEDNIVVSRRADVPVVHANWLKRDVVMRRNVFWSAAGDRTLPYGADESNRWEDPRLGRDGMPQWPGWRGFDPQEVGPK